MTDNGRFPALACRVAPASTVATTDAVLVPSVPVRSSVPLCTRAVSKVPVPAQAQASPAMVRLWKPLKALDAVPVPCNVTVLVPLPPLATPTISEPVCSTSVTSPLPPWMAVPLPPSIRPALVMVVAPLVERTPMPLLLMMRPPARLVIVAVNDLPSVLETTASALPLLLVAPVASTVPLLVNVLLLPCMYTAGALRPLLVSVPLLSIVPFPPSRDAARALLPEVVTVPVLMIVLLAAPLLLCPQAAVMP